MRLTEKQIQDILTSGLAAMGALGGSFGGMGGGGGGAIGGAIGAKITPTAHLEESMPVTDMTATLTKLREFLEEPPNGVVGEGAQAMHTLIGVIGSGFLNMNPCVIECELSSTSLTISAHAKEGLIKQNTCRKGIDMLKKELQ